jgi:hypothetical protein
MSVVKVLWSHAGIKRQRTLQTAQSSFDFSSQNSPAGTHQHTKKQQPQSSPKPHNQFREPNQDTFAKPIRCLAYKSLVKKFHSPKKSKFEKRRK